MGGHPNVDGHFTKTVCPKSLSTVILMTQQCYTAGKYNSGFIELQTQDKT